MEEIKGLMMGEKKRATKGKEEKKMKEEKRGRGKVVVAGKRKKGNHISVLCEGEHSKLIQGK